MNPPHAKFQVIDSFKMTNRGFVLVGNILEGIINIGDTIRIDQTSHEILGVEMVDKIRERITQVGLVIPFQSDDVIKRMEDIKGQVIEIFN